MTQLDTNIPLQIKTPNLADLADMYFGAKKFKEDQLTSQQERALKIKQGQYQANADTRAGKQEVRTQSEYDQTLLDLATKRQDALHSRLNSYLGEEAEALDNLPQEKRSEYYSKYLIPNLKKAGLDVSDMPEYSDNLIEGWRKRAMSPGERATERNTKVKAAGSDMYDLKIDKDGNYVYIPKTPITIQPGQNPNGVVNSGIQAPPQMGVVQGPNGPMGYSFPRGGGAPTAAPIAGPAGAPVERPKIAIPTTVQNTIRNNLNQMSVVSQIVQGLANPKINPTGPGKDLVSKPPYGDQINAYFDPQGEPTRELIGKLSSLKMKDISGAVINAAEMPRLAQWIPQLKDTKAVANIKLQHFMNEIVTMNKEINSQYTSEQGYRPDPLLNGASSVATPKAQIAPAPVQKKAITEADIDKMTEEELKAYLGGG